MFVIICADFVTRLEAFGPFDVREDALDSLDESGFYSTELTLHLAECNEHHHIIELK